MYKVACTNSIYSFSKNNKPVLNIKSGDEVIIETMDCFSNQIQDNRDRLEAMDWNRVNPAAGPIFIEGAQPCDVLKVTINKIELNNKVVLSTGENLGVLGGKLKGLSSSIKVIENNEVVFDDKLRLPLNKMIGVIGTAPLFGEINCGTPGSHGGNMDNTMITEGSILYLPVFIEGALFALGDLHAVMGDGEIGVSGAEAAGMVYVKLEVIKELRLQNPLLENGDSICTISSAETLDEAVNKAVIDMADILTERINLPYSEITMLLSLVGQAQICQVVDPLKTARFVVPKWVLERYDFKLV
jgi:Predicted acetamidase/formamidase